MTERTKLSCELLVDQVYRDIRRRIINGELLPGSRLGTRLLCEFYGISDTPLKQALNRLLSEGLVEALPHRGMRVRRLEQNDIREAIEARIMIESYAVNAAIRSTEAGSDLIERLEANIEEDRRLILEAGDLSIYSETAEKELEVSQRFHEMLVENVQNGVILRAYRNIINHRYIYYQFNINKRKQVLSSLDEHEQILDCLRRRDADGMRRAILHHLETREYDVSSAYRSTTEEKL